MSHKSKNNKSKNNSKILVWVDNSPKGRYLFPSNFWNWKKQTRKKYVLKRWPNAEAVHNATPPGHSKRKFQWI